MAPPVPARATDRARRARGPWPPVLVVGLVLLAALAAVALLAPLLAAHDPHAISGRALERPSSRHWLGTDVPGRDILAQLLYGARASLVVAVLAGSMAMTGAVFVGVVPALLGGAADTVSSRLVVFLLALPGLPLLVLIGALAGNRRAAVILVIAFLGVAPNARILRSQALSLRARGFVAAAQGFGGGPLYILRRHLVPGLGPLIVVGFVNWAGLAIGLEAGLAFVGLGDPSGVSWGLMLNRALAQSNIYFSAMWTWWVLPAGLAVAVTVLGFTLVGVGLEPSLNPRWLRST
ncbi:MAG TPA: ABC transporter permease [Acidimicrobiales bacterium]|nr:ABC transporter permease [Acidimicrobiales bacterium]